MMNGTYQPDEVEAKWYSVWEESGSFKPEVNPDGRPYTIVIPPPNVTGVLHMGHALDHAIQDVIIRRKRMQGYAALWLPGTDHAGIATQNVVERELRKEGMTRHDVGREAFIEQVWAWKARSGNTISTQMRKLGDSTDWSRERFTFDEGLSNAVRKVFVELYNDGLMYRANRIINWCPRCHTALSEIEVEHEDVAGELTYIKYPFTDGTGFITVATTRPETMLGDTGIAVHPSDERYKDAIGKTVTLPLVGRKIPVVADEGVEFEFGTGAVKVTPAHDPLDFDIGQRHGLETVVVIDTEGNITQAGGEFFDMDRFEAREAVRSRLRDVGAIDKVEDHHHSVGHCSRCGTIVEPMLSLQWFVKVEPLVGPAIDAVRTDESRFIPKRWEKNYFHWMENLQDWCVSRQLWWGHRIPAWYCDDCDETIVSMDDAVSCPACGSSSLTRDEDVLDTWFSSALWPFSTLGWPDDTEDFSKFYPTTTLVTGFDIIFFWVARMMKMALHFTDQVPFTDIVIHGMVRDMNGRKMSKSSGNALDPLELIDEYGADSVRLALIQAAAPGHDIPLSTDWIDASRRFGNKLWNAMRFAVEFMGVSDVPADGGYPSDPGPEDAWILSRLADVTSEFDSLLDEYRLSDAYGLLYNFAWSEVFDWYLEMAKSLKTDEQRSASMRATLGVVLRDLLKLFHPAIPFVTEELWSHLGDGESLLITAPWPSVPTYGAPEGMNSLQEIVTGIRQFRSQHQIGRKVDMPLTVVSDRTLPQWWFDQVAALTGATPLPGARPDPVTGYTRVSGGPGVGAFISLDGLVDVDAERPRIEKAIGELEASLARSQAKLDNESFTQRAPADVVEAERARVAEISVELDKQRTQLAELG
jgi:valyl-tRNA synthetase